MTTTTLTPSVLRSLLDDALARHADAPADIAALLLAQAPTLPADAEGAEAIRLAEHVLLGHCADADGLAAFVAALPPALTADVATAPALQRVRWALAQVRAQMQAQMQMQAPLGSDASPALPDALRWRALQNVVLALAGQGRCGEAAALLAADEAAALAHGADEAGVAYATAANNVAGHLQTGNPGAVAARGATCESERDTERDADRDALMLQAAAIARRAWASAGNWMHVERAEYRLALCHAAAGNGAAAEHHAGLCLAGCLAAGEAADAVEHYFAHEALVRAHRAAGDAPAASAALQHMAGLLTQISQADGLRDWCAETLADLQR